jgi:ketosteroid isomerase-like protein
VKPPPSPGRFGTAEECEAAFYEAFRSGDLAAMKRIWTDGDDCVCIHPARPPITGRSAVLQSWEQILVASGGLEVRFECQSRTLAERLAVHIGIEIIGPQGQPPALVTVTNIYGLTARGWKLRAHHAGPIHRDATPRGAVH